MLIVLHTLYNFIYIHLRLFADDACSTKNLVKMVINTKFIKIYKYLNANRLLIVIELLFFSIFNTKNVFYFININCFVIGQNKNIKYLRVILKEKLNWRVF